MKHTKKKIICASLVFTLSFVNPKVISPIYSENNSNIYVKRYSNGYVFIGFKEDIDSLISINKDDDLLVVDLRNSFDPNMKIINSYAVDNIKEMIEIIEILLEYEKQNPSDWDRSEETMLSEWIIHNILYKLNYKLDHTTDVDFNNLDEDVYSLKLKNVK